MPSGPKKRKSAKKKKELEETLKNAPDILEESIPESTTDSVLTTAQKDEGGDCLNSKKTIVNQDLVPRDSIAVSEEISENLKMFIQTEDRNEEDGVLSSENSKSMEQIERFKPTLIQELQGIMLEVEGLKGTVIRQLQAIEKVTAVLHKIVDDFNSFQLIGVE